MSPERQSLNATDQARWKAGCISHTNMPCLFLPGSLGLLEGVLDWLRVHQSDTLMHEVYTILRSLQHSVMVCISGCVNMMHDAGGE